MRTHIYIYSLHFRVLLKVFDEPTGVRITKRGGRREVFAIKVVVQKRQILTAYPIKGKSLIELYTMTLPYIVIWSKCAPVQISLLISLLVTGNDG